MDRSARSRPTGPGSRGGTYHLPGEAARYCREWRAAHPDYRERESDRHIRRRAIARGDDPELALVAAREKRKARQLPAIACRCECGCKAEIVTICRFCWDGLHDVEDVPEPFVNEREEEVG